MFENWSTIKKLIWLKYTLAAKVKEILYTLSGSSPLSFDQAVAKPMEHLITNIKPVQNLNGYDAPWPGGGGTNKLPIKEEYIVLYKYINNNGEVIWNNNNFYVDYYIPVTPNTEYNITITTPISYCSIMEYDENKTFVTRNLFNCTGSTEFATETQVFTTSSNTKYVLFGANLDSTRVSFEKVLSYKYQLQTGNFTGFTPYENVCPIQGWKTITAWDDAKYGGNIEWNQYVTDPTTKANMKPLPNGTQIINGHEYLLIFNGSKISEQQSSIMYFYIGRNSGVYATVAVGSYKFYTATTTVTADGTVNDNANSVWGYLAGDCNWGSFNVFDLTRMFGAGNEPETLEEFRSLFPLDYYPYNAGEHTCVGAVNGEPYRKVPVTFGALGKNLGHIGTDNYVSGQRYDAEYKNGGVVITSTNEYGRAGYSIPVKAGNQYTISLKAKRNGTAYAIQFNDSNEFAYNYWVIAPTETLTTYSRTITATSDILFVGIYPNAPGSSITVEDFQVELGSSATSFESYTDTIYGGMLDLVTGDGTITWINETIGNTNVVLAGDGSSKTYTSYVVTPNAQIKSASGNANIIHLISDKLKSLSWSNAWTPWSFAPTNQLCDGIRLIVPYHYYASADELKTAMSAVQLVYELDTPVPFHVDGVSVTPLKGKNNVWTDCGDMLSVTYISSDVSSAVGYAKTDEATAV